MRIVLLYLKIIMLREEEALQVLADLHGGGDKNNELVVLEYEEIKQQVHTFSVYI